MDDNTIYVSTNLLLPYKHFNVDFCEISLTLYSGRKKLKFLNRGKTHFSVPRFYLTDEEIKDAGCPVIYLPTPTYEKIDFKHNIKIRYSQEPAWEALSKADSGFLTLAPGKGKTVLSLLKIAQNKTPALISVNTTTLIEQWKERIEEFLDISPEDIGIIADGKMNWKKPICISTIQSLVACLKNKKIPKEFHSWFGQYYVDEGHHIGGPEFCTTAQLCTGKKYILSANSERTDGAEKFIRYFFGPTIFKDKGYELDPVIKIVPIDGSTVSSDNTEKEMTLLSMDRKANLEKIFWITYFSRDRKSIAVSTRVEQLREFHKAFKRNSCVIISDTPKKERLPLLKESQISFIIDNFGIEALDCPELDTLFMLLPVSADKKINPNGTYKLLGNNLIQIMGRILRSHPKKQDPLVIIFDDVNVPSAHRQVENLVRVLKQNGFRYSYEDRTLDDIKGELRELYKVSKTM